MTKLLVLGAGGPAGWNFIKSVSEAGHEVIGCDTNPYHVELIRKECTCYLIKKRGERSVEEINKIIKKHNITFIHAQPDDEVRWLSENKQYINAITFLPDHDVVLTCQDKKLSGDIWNTNAIGLNKTIIINEVDDVLKAEDVLGFPMWIRATHGAGGKGSTFASNPESVMSWIEYWRYSGKDWKFIAQEYLPGRNIAVHTLWKDGRLIVAQARERLEYIYPNLAPSGITGTPSVQVTTNDGVSEAIEAVKAIDNKPNGVYCVDLKGRKKKLIPTEINVGRFFTTSYFFTQLGLNMPDLYVKLGMDDEVRMYNNVSPLKEGIKYIRHIDMGCVISDK